MLEILGRRKKNNPVLIGEPGVGKSAIVEGLAQLINNQETSPMFFNKRLVSLDLTAIVAGTKFRGQFEERIKNVIKELENHPEIIIFIDEIHTMIGAGSGEGSMDAANILKPAWQEVSSSVSVPPRSMSIARALRRTEPWSAVSRRLSLNLLHAKRPC